MLFAYLAIKTMKNFTLSDRHCNFIIHILYKNTYISLDFTQTTVFAPEGDMIHVRINVTFGTAEGTKIPFARAVNKHPAGDALPSR